jgi:hypothetical protein
LFGMGLSLRRPRGSLFSLSLRLSPHFPGELPPWNRPNKRDDITDINYAPNPAVRA